jgi:hypothetical protein
MIVHLMLFTLIFFCCSLFGFEFKFHFQTQRHLLCFPSLFSLSFLSFGPSPAGLFLSPLLLLFCSPALPAVLSLPLSSIFRARPARPRPRPSLLPFLFPSPARVAHQPLPWPIGAPALPRSLPILSLSCGPHLSGVPFPAPDRDSGSYPARLREITAAFSISASGLHTQAPAAAPI